MSEWTFEQKIKAFEDANGRDPWTGYSDVGEHILDLRERAELATAAAEREALLANNLREQADEAILRAEKAEQRCAALEAALTHAASETADPYCVACPQCRNKMRETLSGDTSALRDMLEKAAFIGLTENDSDWKVPPHNEAKAIAKRVMEGR